MEVEETMEKCTLNHNRETATGNSFSTKTNAATFNTHKAYLHGRANTSFRYQIEETEQRYIRACFRRGPQDRTLLSALNDLNVATTFIFFLFLFFFLPDTKHE